MAPPAGGVEGDVNADFDQFRFHQRDVQLFPTAPLTADGAQDIAGKLLGLALGMAALALPCPATAGTEWGAAAVIP